MSSFAARKEDEAKAAMPSPWLQERGSTGLRHGLQGPQERGQVQDRQVPGGTQGQGHAFECCKAGGGDATHGPVGGIHWHMNVGNKIEYVASDEARQKIPYVRVTELSQGVVTEFRSPRFTNTVDEA